METIKQLRTAVATAAAGLALAAIAGLLGYAACLAGGSSDAAAGYVAEVLAGAMLLGVALPSLTIHTRE